MGYELGVAVFRSKTFPLSTIKVEEIIIQRVMVPGNAFKGW